MTRKRSKKTKALGKRKPKPNLRPFLPGGSVEREYRQLQAKFQERFDFMTGNWLVEGRPMPSFVPARAQKAVASATAANLKINFARHKAAIADEATRLRTLEKKIGIRRKGRPSGPSNEQNIEEFLGKVVTAVQRLEVQGKRVTAVNLAGELGRVERTLQRDCEKWGFTWKELREAIRSSGPDVTHKKSHRD